MLVAFEVMMRNKIVMPAHFLREAGVKMGETFDHFSDAAQRLGIYTSADYIQILVDLIEEWKVDSLSDLTDSGEKARDYLMALPDRLTRIAQRMKTPELQYKFSWITA
jgi:acyl-[acyl-carrier-protein] desaturase